MNTKGSIEKKIRLSAILIYIIVALLCIGMLIYLYNQREQIGFQKQNIEKKRETLVFTNKLIHFVNQAQTNANLYIVSKKPEYIDFFQKNMQEIHVYVDTLKFHSAQEIQKTGLDVIEPLLKKKLKTISELNTQFDSYNFVDSVNKRLRTQELSLLNDVVLLKTISQKTVIETSDTLKKGFFKRLADAFSSNKSKPKQKQETTITTDISNINPTPPAQDTISILSELLNIAHKARKNYSRQITDIEKQVAALMISDQEISIQLSHLLIDLHQQTISSTMKEIGKSEQLIRQNYINSIVGSIISLFLILTLIVFIIRNANEGRRMRITMERANMRAQKSYESRHKLLLSLSHDVKTPINSILGYLEMWKQGYVISEKEVSAMQHSGMHILELMENLLEFSKLDQGLVQETPVNFKLYNLCSEVIEIFNPLALQKKLSFNVHFNFDNTLQLHSDALKIKQIIINILSNAVKYTVKGSVQFHVSYTNGCIYFDVKDTGKGIPAKQLDTIYDAFMRVEENSSLASGSGFGLFVAKGMTTLLNGTITINSIVDKGTQIIVVIPAQEVIEQGVKPKKIIVVDDDIVFLSMLEKMLSQLGHQASTCNSVETCEKLSENILEYDLILTDSDMITFSGKDILQKVRSKGIILPVFLMSGRNDLNNETAKQMGFNGFLQKPVTPASLQTLFGGNEKTSNSLPSLEELFGDDKEIINKVLIAFIGDTNKHIILLEQAIAENDFTKAEKICHKMAPMFKQLAMKDAVVLFDKINELKGKTAHEQSSWKEDVLNVIKISQNVILDIETPAETHLSI